MSKIAGIVGLLGFVCSLFIHGLTFTGVDVEANFPFFWFLHVGVFVVFLPFVLALRKELGANPTHSQMKSLLPLWANLVIAATFAYAAANFVLFIFHSEGASPSFRDGVYVLQSHGNIIRELTLAEYNLHKSYVIRGFSGHWLVFYLVPCMYFFIGIKSRAPQTAGVGPN